MIKFNVEIVETLRRAIEVNADSKNDAIDKTKQLYYDGKIVLDVDNFDNMVKFTSLKHE